GTATQLAAASEHQALQIAAASNAINRMTGSIDLVSATDQDSWALAETRSIDPVMRLIALDAAAICNA
ncbi:hypothetical protein QCD79_34595, partial [Pseudomonas quasicaspiana]|nr:hypothetical protein [Pseudomonas quasicaspiana]